MCQGARPCFAGRVDHLRPVAGSPSAGAGVCQGRPVCEGQTFEQVFDQGASNKCSKQVFDSVFGSVCQNFEPNLTEFLNRTEPNFNRILTESESLSVFNRIFDWFVASSGITRSVSSS